MLLYTLAFLVLGLIWGAHWYLRLPIWMPLAATGVTLLFVLVVKLVRRRRARAKKKAELAAEKPPEAPAPEPPKAAPAEAPSSIQAMKAEFARAVSALEPRDEVDRCHALDSSQHCC